MADPIQHIAPGQHPVFQPQEGVKLQLLHGGPTYQVFLLEVEANTRCQPGPHEGEELRYVLQGTVVFTVGEREIEVSAGGSLRHPSMLPHGFLTKESAATFLTFTLARDYNISALFRGMAESNGLGA